MKYIKGTTTKHLITGKNLGEPETLYYSQVIDGVVQNEQFGPGPGDRLYAEMEKDIEAGTAEIEEIDITPVQSWTDKRIEAYGSWQEQLDMLYHGTWRSHVEAVKTANPKE